MTLRRSTNCVEHGIGCLSSSAVLRAWSRWTRSSRCPVVCSLLFGTGLCSRCPKWRYRPKCTFRCRRCKLRHCRSRPYNKNRELVLRQTNLIRTLRVAYKLKTGYQHSAHQKLFSRTKSKELLYKANTVSKRNWKKMHLW